MRGGKNSALTPRKAAKRPNCFTRPRMLMIGPGGGVCAWLTAIRRERRSQSEFDVIPTVGKNLFMLRTNCKPRLMCGLVLAVHGRMSWLNLGHAFCRLVYCRRVSRRTWRFLGSIF